MRASLKVIYRPISTHGKRGVVGRHDAEHHSLIHSTEAPPTLLQGEHLNNYAIKVDIPEGAEHLHAASRVNYSQTYTVQNNVKVKKIGTVNADLMKWVKRYWKACNDE